MEMLTPVKKRKFYDEELQSKLMFELKYSSNSIEMEKTFNQLYDNLTKVLWNNFTRKYIPPLNHDEMRDLFQDSWIKVLDSRASFDDSKKAYTWVYTIFKNMIIDRIRFFERKKTQSYDKNTSGDDDIQVEFKANRNSDADFQLIRNEKLYHIKKAINELDDELDKTIIMKRIVEQKKFDEISKELKIPIATIHYKLNKSLDKLRNKLNFLIN